MRRHVRDFHPEICLPIESRSSVVEKSDSNSSTSYSDDDDKVF
jgi:hypothetical protein